MTFGHELRTAGRALLRAPGATALCICSMALSIALASVLFSVCDTLFFKPVPFRDPASLVSFSSRSDDGERFLYGYPDYLDVVAAGAGKMDVLAQSVRGTFLAGDAGNESLTTVVVTPNYFSVLGIGTLLGKPSVEPQSGRRAVVLGHRLWQRRFHGDPNIVGQTIRLNTQPFVVTGVLPPSFAGEKREAVFDIWISTDSWFDIFALGERQDRNGELELRARLEPGVTLAQGEGIVEGAIRGEGKHKPAPRGVAGTYAERPFVHPWSSQLAFGGGFLLVVGLLLFVGCANVAQVRLAQSEIRRKEYGIRLALGAGARGMTRLILAEIGLIAVSGAGLGLLLANWLIGALVSALESTFDYATLGARLDGRSLLFTAAATVAAAVLVSVVPLRHALRLNPGEVLQSGSGVAGLRIRWQRALIVGQTAVSVLLIGTAALAVASFGNARAFRPGFDANKKMYVLSVLPVLQMPRAEWCERITERLAALPGARAATFARYLPLSGSGSGFRVRVEIPGQRPFQAGLNNVAGNYFQVMGTRVLAGRGIDRTDRPGSTPVAVIGESFARQHFAGRNPLGAWISIQGDTREIVGIAEDSARGQLHGEAGPVIYLPFSQVPWGDLTLLVETAVEPSSLARAVRAEVRRFDPGAYVYDTGTLEGHMRRAQFLDRTAAQLTSGLGFVSFVLTSAGLFGLVQFLTNRRVREIGLRVALGATPGGIQGLVVRESLRSAGWGIPLGLLGLWGVASEVRSAVLGVGPLDPRIYLAAALSALLLILVAAWLPSRRAARLDPMAALREE